jgi:hypothetical protein
VRAEKQWKDTSVVVGSVFLLELGHHHSRVWWKQVSITERSCSSASTSDSEQSHACTDGALLTANRGRCPDMQTVAPPGHCQQVLFTAQGCDQCKGLQEKCYTLTIHQVWAFCYQKTWTSRLFGLKDSLLLLFSKWPWPLHLSSLCSTSLSCSMWIMIFPTWWFFEWLNASKLSWCVHLVRNRYSLEKEAQGIHRCLTSCGWIQVARMSTGCLPNPELASPHACSSPHLCTRTLCPPAYPVFLWQGVSLPPLCYRFHSFATLPSAHQYYSQQK